jgi:L-aminopeptidase/D-esterase-like protein
MPSSPRARGLAIGFEGGPGAFNAITDVPGVEVGMVTVAEANTGVTAILPRGRTGVGRACAAGRSVLNGNGEMTGVSWIDERGAVDQPILVTGTPSIGACHTGAVRWTTDRYPELAARWLLPVVCETWDGHLSDPLAGHVTPELAMRSLDSATGGPVAEGSVGGGAGMTCYGFKAGSGTSSRSVRHRGSDFTVGVFVQANFGARRELTIAGVRVGHRLDVPQASGAGPSAAPGAGSVIAVVATDAPLLPDQCRALARRVPLGLARTGTTGSHFSGDLFLAFSTANAGALTSAYADDEQSGASYESLEFIPWGMLDPLLEAVVQATEEAVVNALVAGRDTVGPGGSWSPGLPHDQLLALLGPTG